MSGNHSGLDDKWTVAFPVLETPDSKTKSSDSSQQEYVRPFQLFSRSLSTQSSPNGSWEPIPPASPLPERLPMSFDVNAAPFSPSNTATSFDPFDSKDEDYDDADLSQHLLSTNLLDDFDADVKATPKSSATTPATTFNGTLQSPWALQNPSASWYPLTSGQPEMESSVRNIWENGNQIKDEWWNRFEPYSYEDENEFDPTLQYYHGHLLDADTIQDMNRLSLSVTNPSLEESQAENVGEDMSSLQMLESIFTDVSQADLMEALEQHDYDMDRAIEALLNRKRPATSQTSVTNTQTSPPNSTVEVAPKKRQVCRHFLAGECYRKDCWFAHDLQVKVCKFWLQGSCLKGDYCEFSHHIDVQEVASKITNPSQKPPSQKQQLLRFDESEYPDLSASTNSQKSTAPKQTSPIISEDFPSLATAAKIKTPPTSNKQPAINFAAAAKKKGTGKVTSKQASKKATSVAESRLMQKLKQPVRIPWLETGSALNTQYLQQREQAIKYGMLRNRFFSRATAYYMKGDGAKAKAYSNEAKYYNQLMQQMHNEASRRIFELRNQHEAFIDLHGLHVDEALSMIQERFEALKSYEGIVYIVTGTGHHSGSLGLSKKQSKLKPSVEEFLRRENYKFAETSIIGDNKGGVFAVILQPSR